MSLLFFTGAVNVVLESIDEIQFLQDTPWIQRDVDGMRQVLANLRLRSLLTVRVPVFSLVSARLKVPFRPYSSPFSPVIISSHEKTPNGS